MNTHPIPAASSPSVTAQTQPKQVLVPIDFSPESIAALKAAASAAEQSNAHLTLLNVVESGTVYRGTEVPGSHRKLQEAHGRRLAELAERVLPSSLSADMIVGDGDPESEINRIATQRHADYVVLGQHQRRRWFGGDTARKVEKSAPCKVIVWKAEGSAVAFQA